MRGTRCFLIVCLLAAASGHVSGWADDSARGSSFSGWPDSFEGRAIEEVALTSKEAEFYRSFPGEIARFSDGKQQIIFRWIDEPTQHLHPAATCFQGQGFVIQLMDGLVDERGSHWGVFRAIRGEESFVVREQVYTNSETWSDISAWYWSATLGRTSGPWCAVMVATPD